MIATKNEIVAADAGAETTLFPLWREVVKQLVDDGLKPGDVLFQTDLSEKFGLVKPKTADEQKKWQVGWMVAFNPFRDELLTNHCICLKPGYDGSYIVIPPGEQVAHAESYHVKKIHGEINKAAAKIKHVDASALTDEQKHQQMAALGRMAFMKNAVRSRNKIGVIPPPPKHSPKKLGVSKNAKQQAPESGSTATV